jgi:hypothetical protein
LSPGDHIIDCFIGDGMYDQAPVYAAVAHHAPGSRMIVPPRKDAVSSSQVATSPTQRDGHLVATAGAGDFPGNGRRATTRRSTLRRRFLVTNGCLAADYGRSKEGAQEREAAIACGLLNRMREWGRPQSYQVG